MNILSQFKDNGIANIRAGIVVSLIALPLSLGISLASGAPSSAGLISAILGGILGSILGGSYVTINGPAAGLIVVVLSAIQSLGDGDPQLGFRRMLACMIVVGVLQISSGVFRLGRFAALFPLSVVHGMLSAIGLIIIIKQSHVFFGHASSGSIIQSMLAIPQSFLHPVPESAIIGLLSLVLLLIYPHIKLGFTKNIPAPLIIAILGIVMGMYLHPSAMVKLPTNPREIIITPIFDVITSLPSILSIITIYFVASLESILSASAVDQLDPLKRESNFDRELWSKGIVNISCGLIGGLPIIAEIVRSSANITQGARGPLANFSHGIFILIYLVLLPTVLNHIPLSALAAILILVGYRLAHPSQFKEMWNLGAISFISFLTTIALTLAEDLLIGVLAGIAVKLIGSLIMGAKFSQPKYNLERSGDKAILAFEGSLSFFSALKQREIIAELSKFREVKIDLTNLTFIDATSLIIIEKESHKIEKNGGVVDIKIPSKFEDVYKHIKKH